MKGVGYGEKGKGGKKALFVLLFKLPKKKKRGVESWRNQWRVQLKRATVLVSFCVCKGRGV